MGSKAPTKSEPPALAPWQQLVAAELEKAVADGKRVMVVGPLR